MLIADLDAEQAAAAAAQIHDTRAAGIAADVTDRGALQRAVATAIERFGSLDVLVANAGIVSPPATLRAMAPETVERILETNLFGVWRSVDAALPEIVARQGHIVVISSVYAFINGVGTIPYAMSKAAVEQLGRALRLELAPHGASVSVAYFGFIDTEMIHRAIDQDPLATELMRTFPAPLRKRVSPAVAGEAIVAGIERRSPRIFRPRRWSALSVLRGIVNPLSDMQLERDARAQGLTRRLDERAGEDQPTTA